MKKVILLLIAALACGAGIAQSLLKNAYRNSWFVNVYRISADTAQRYVMKGIPTVDHYIDQKPVAVFHRDSIAYEKLPVGNYLTIAVEGDELVVNCFSNSNIDPFVVNNEQRPQLLLRNKNDQQPVSNASVFIDGKTASYNSKAGTYSVRKKKLDEDIVKVIVPGDTSFYELDVLSAPYRSPGRQRWLRFKGTKVGRVITWFPDKIRYFIKSKPRNWFRKRYKRKASPAKGYMIFNKPKYFPVDTIRFKAYIVNRKGKPYKKSLPVYLEYSAWGRSVSKQLTMLKPLSDGAYVYTFPTSDSMPNDTRYEIVFKNSKNKVLLREDFRIEDYLLDEVATYGLSTDKEEYLAGDTFHIRASAKDANGLPVMDGRVNIYLLTRRVTQFNRTREFVQDTIWKEEKQLAVDGDTKFAIPSTMLPQVNAELEALAVFRNSNNELEEKRETIQFKTGTDFILVTEDERILKAVYYEKGVAKPKKGWMETDIADSAIAIDFPFTITIDPMVESYDFFTKDNEGNWLVNKTYTVESRDYDVSFIPLQHGDTAGFRLLNPYRIPVYYSLFDHNKEMLKASSTDEMIQWKDKLPPGKMFTLKWQYYWGGEERYKIENFGLLHKLMTSEIKGASTIYPGQKDTITVAVKDYRGRDAGDVNLTVAGYNTQFGRDVSLPHAPYIDKFRGKTPIIYSKYEIGRTTSRETYSLGKHAGWLQPLRLDTMAYYRFLFPGKNYRMVRTQISSTLIPQVSIYAVQKGKRQEIHLLYINRELVYYNETNSYKPNAFSVYPGFAQIAFRLKDKYVEIDSIYMQPFYKHDISFDLDSLPANARVTPMPDTWTWAERALLEKSILRMESNSRNNGGYIWQGDRVEFLSEVYRGHKAGPFRANDSIQFFKKFDFDFRFFYEAGYTYRITPQMVRMEKIPLFSTNGKVFLPRFIDTRWILGDTLIPAPGIRYDKPTGPILEYVGGNTHNVLYSRIMIELPSSDTAIAYTVLHQRDTSMEYRVLWGGVDKIYSVSPGTYSIVLVTRRNQYMVADDIVVTTKGTYCINMRRTRFDHKNEFVEMLQAMQKENQRIAAEAWEKAKLAEQRETNKNLYDGPRLNMQGGTSTIKGVVRDERGKDVIVSATVYLKGYNLGTATNTSGEFALQGIRPGRYVLVFAYVGYESLEQAVTISDGQVVDVAVSLKVSEKHLEEVVVVGYGTSTRKSVTGSIATVSAKNIDLVQSLQGKVAGVSVTGLEATTIRIRGAGSINDSVSPLYVVDGVPMDQLPEGWDQSQVAGMEILKDATNVALYGSRAANGVILITTKGFNGNVIRKDFKDYAIWQPNLITDKNGEAKFAVTYPDNVTSWQTWVVGMDRKRRITSASKLVKAFKPLLAQLSTPQFLIAGDSATLIGKKINYTTSDITTAVSFTVNDKQVYESNETIAKNNSSINELKIQAGADTIIARFQVKANGFADGEERKIPVFRKGTMETKGNFYILEKDTSIAFTADPLAGRITLLAQNNTFDLLLDEISQLNKYPYYCMEQIASKLTGLAMEKKIRTALGQPFRNEKLLQPLISRLQKGQRFDGGWGWWQEGETSMYITNYITRALVEMDDHPLLRTNIRNALLYLQNQLPYISRNTLLESLYTLSEAKHEMDYYIYLRKMPFDSLPQHQQWQIVSILQQQKMSYEKELNKLMVKKTATMLGGIHWGDNNYYWERNAIATTVIAYKVLLRDGKYDRETQQVIQYFLEMKRGGYWRNTVEAATILSAIIPQKIKENQNFTQNAVLTIAGDTSLSVTQFPFATTIGTDKKQLRIQKSGGGMVYFTAWQELFNPAPTVVDSLFRINSYFKNQYDKVTTLKAGEKVTLQVRVEAMSDADYVQLEIPIPAGCTYGPKTNSHYSEHREYFKDRVVIFIEKMKKGNHTYEIELEPRYTGQYTINPAKAELMYFPTFYGRDEMKSVRIN